MNTLTMHYTVFLLVLLFPGFSLRPPCGSEQRTDRPMVIKRHRNSSFLLSDSAVTCPSSDSSLLGLAHCFAETRPTPSRDVQDEGLTELELSVFPQLIGQKPLLSAVPGRLWPQMACLWEQWENLCPQAVMHCLWNEVASVVPPLCLSDEETETHMLTEIFQVLFPPQEDIRENLTVGPSWFLWFTYDLCLALSFSAIYTSVVGWGTFCYFKTVPSSNYEHEEELNMAGSVWIPALCLQLAWGCEKA